MKTSVLCLAFFVVTILISGCGSSSSRTVTESSSSSSTEQVVTSSAPVETVASAPVVQEAPSSGATLVLTDGSFSQIRSTRGIAVVDFATSWCGGCKKLSPVVDELAAEYAGSAVIAKVDIDDSPATAKDFNIYKIPCLILFKNGKEVDRFEGFHPKAQVKAWIQKHGGDPSVAIVVPE